jgi:hypothetical protein
VRLCLDEHYPPQIAVELRARGHDVVSVNERPELVSLSDAELLAAMAVERRALVTENVADFAPLARQLAATGEHHHGLVFTSPRSLPRSRRTIGVYVTALAALLERFPGRDALTGHTQWLGPPS